MTGCIAGVVAPPFTTFIAIISTIEITGCVTGGATIGVGSIQARSKALFCAVAPTSNPAY